jgi:hypothetical protein
MRVLHVANQAIRPWRNGDRQSAASAQMVFTMSPLTT